MNNSETITIQSLAQTYLEYFDRDTSESGQEFYKTKDNAPPELSHLVREAHGDMLPDNYKYEYIVTALEFISSCDDPEEPEIEADPYYSDLLRWLSSNLTRSEYVDEYVQEFGLPDSEDFQIMSLIGYGQWKEKQEVYWDVLRILQKIVEDL